MNRFFRTTLLSTAALILCNGCSKKPPVNHIIDYMSALNGYFAARPNCLWPEPVKFPVKVSISDAAKNAPYMGLVEHGLLMQSTRAKTVVALSKDETEYDLTPRGRVAWNPDDYHPGSGNFCYGNVSTDWVGFNTPNNGKIGAKSDIVFGYSIKGVPDWAKAPELQAAFPKLKDDLSAEQHLGRATVMNTDTGWQVQAVDTNPPDLKHVK